mmetsp:Transcript_20627/g.55199  ORF Transcript_20627/g.55199 Transcript_20627/m.55199 type:complete len:209 (+) Transcript_20627:178-804(+)
MSVPILTLEAWPDFSIASVSNCSASSLSVTLGAKPPSSPTFVASWPYLAWITFFRVWYTSAPICSASRKEEAPTGRTMNSWTGRPLPAWLPPLITLKAGTGSTYLSELLPASSATLWYSVWFLQAAAARQTAMLTARMAFAPSFSLLQPHSFWEPSSSSYIILSSSACSRTFLPNSFGAMTSLTFFTAVRTPFPKYRDASLSRSSSAS